MQPGVLHSESVDVMQLTLWVLGVGAFAIMTRMDARFVRTAEVTGASPVAIVVDVIRAVTVAAWIIAQGSSWIVVRLAAAFTSDGVTTELD